MSNELVPDFKDLAPGSEDPHPGSEVAISTYTEHVESLVREYESIVGAARREAASIGTSMFLVGAMCGLFVAVLIAWVVL